MDPQNTTEVAGRAFARATAGWPPDREVFQANADEILALCGGGGRITKNDFDNGDGTFTTEVSYQDKKFIYVGNARLRAFAA
jgi:hypothetical protein